MDRCVCVYVPVCSSPASLKHQGEDTFHSEPSCWLAHAPCSTGTFHQTHATNCTFSAQELRLLLPYPQLLCAVCGEGQLWKHLVFLECGKTFVLQEL